MTALLGKTVSMTLTNTETDNAATNFQLHGLVTKFPVTMSCNEIIGVLHRLTEHCLNVLPKVAHPGELSMNNSKFWTNASFLQDNGVATFKYILNRAHFCNGCLQDFVRVLVSCKLRCELFTEAIEIFHVADTDNPVQTCYSPSSTILPFLQAGLTSKFKLKVLNTL